MSATPFTRGRFDALPELPRKPHPYSRIPARRVRVKAAGFGSLELHVREHGEGPPLLLIHGLMTSSYSWRYVLDELGKRFRLVIPDLPGAGRSDKPDGSYDPGLLATSIAGLQDALGIRGCAAIGNSLGGYLCMRVALADPGAFSRLVNVHSPGVPHWKVYALHAALSVPGTWSFLSWWIRRSPLRWAHRHVHYWDETLKSLEEAREYGDPLSTPDGARAFVRYLAETVAPGPMNAFLAELRARKEQGKPFPCPLLLVYSEQDPMVPPSIGDRLAELLPGVTLTKLADTSHFAHVDSPERLVTAVLPFLEAAPAASPRA